MEKLRDLVGDEGVERLAEATLMGRGTFRTNAATVAGEDLGWFFEQWRYPYPEFNYVLEGIDEGEREGDLYTTTVRLRREGDPVREPVSVAGSPFLGDEVEGTWDGNGEEGAVVLRTPEPIWSVRIDPRGRLQEETRSDN